MGFICPGLFLETGVVAEFHGCSSFFSFSLSREVNPGFEKRSP